MIQSGDGLVCVMNSRLMIEAFGLMNEVLNVLKDYCISVNVKNFVTEKKRVGGDRR